MNVEVINKNAPTIVNQSSNDDRVFSYQVSILSIIYQFKIINNSFQSNILINVKRNPYFETILMPLSEMIELVQYDKIDYIKHSKIIYNNFCYSKNILYNTIYTIIDIIGDKIFVLKEEYKMLMQIINIFKLTESEIVNIFKSKFIPDINNIFNKKESKALVKKKYFSIIKNCHPDVLNNVDEFIRNVAKERFRIYSNAYEKIINK